MNLKLPCFKLLQHFEFSLLLCAEILISLIIFCDFNYYLSSLQVNSIVHISISFDLFWSHLSTGCILFIYIFGIDPLRTKGKQMIVGSVGVCDQARAFTQDYTTCVNSQESKYILKKFTVLACLILHFVLSVAYNFYFDFGFILLHKPILSIVNFCTILLLNN